MVHETRQSIQLPSQGGLRSCLVIDPATLTPTPDPTEFLSGNEAIARGAWQAGLGFAAAYPGTPSTEILQTLGSWDEVRAQWSVNEKVALESVVGASLAGARSLAAMKHVGLNVAADPLMTLGLTGVNAGLLIVTADDPGMSSSQNEQDNRQYARFAGLPMLEPSDSQECLEMARAAFQLSEDHDFPVLLRTTTPINHGKGRVSVGARTDVPLRPIPRDREKWVMLPAIARRRRTDQIERLRRLEQEAASWVRCEHIGGSGRIGIVTAGVGYAYCQESLPDVPILKLGMTHPLPWHLLEQFAEAHELLLVVEELDPFLEDALRARGLPAVGKELLPREGRLDPSLIAEAFHHLEKTAAKASVSLPSAVAPAPRPSPSLESTVPRPPVLCPACPYRGVLRALKRQQRYVIGDIGCYTLGALAPHDTIHFTLCMGASIGAASGFAKVRPEGKTLALIGDSTFLHSGMTSLLDLVYNRSSVAVVILDNCAIAMTGGQGHPGTGQTLEGEVGAGVDYEALIRALGVKRVSTVDPYEGERFARALDRDMATPGPTVLIAKRPCVLVDETRSRDAAFVSPVMCTGCRECLDEGCPALVLYQNRRGEDRVKIDPHLCIGCPDCSQVCEPGAISWFPQPVATTED